MWVRELPSFEEGSPRRKWRVRLGAVLVGGAAFLGETAWHKSINDPNGSIRRLIVRLPNSFIDLVVVPYTTLLTAGSGFAFVVFCMTAADGVAHAMRRSRSVRARMLVLGIACAALAHLLGSAEIPQ
jgi:hypothetical protein